MPDVFKFDPAAKTVTFQGDAGLELLYDLLLRAKFGDGYEKPLLVSPWLAGLGIVAAVGILIGVLEEANLKWAGVVNAVAYLVWSIWLLAFGVRVRFLHQ